MSKIQLEIQDCTECPHFHSERHYTSDSFEVVFKQTCLKENKHIYYKDACGDKQPPIPEWCPVKID